jgi:hypothetical protein
MTSLRRPFCGAIGDIYGYRESEADILREGRAFYDTLQRAS